MPAIGESRIFGGIHFQEGNVTRLKLGRLVGKKVWAEAAKYFPSTAGHVAADSNQTPDDP
jgi:hypothetical protein